MEYIVLLVLVVGGMMWLSLRSRTSSPSPHRREGRSADTGLSVRVEITGGDDDWGNHSAANLSTAFDKFWLPQGQSVDAHGYSVEGGLVYVGKDLASADGYSVEPALINPKLKVDAKHPDHSGEGMSYWPAYDRISPRNRAGYLAWLAGGRNNPSAYIGYVFLYFYGLERRILHDHRHGANDNQERVVILSEISRLLKLYGDNNSFARYAQQFLFAIYLSGEQLDLTSNKPVVLPSANELPALIKVGLGQFAKEGRPIPADWALAWMVQDPEIRLRTPALRCREEFAALFKQLYRDRHGEGIVVKPNKTPVSASYRPASGGMRRTFELYVGPTLPDITVLKRPRALLTSLVDQACDKLDSYSRFLGKDGGGRGSIRGLALLPKEIATKVEHAGLNALQSTLKSHLEGHDSAVLRVQDVLHHFPIQKADRFSKREAVLLTQLLERIGLGMEPDVRFTGIKPRPNEQFVVFQQDDDAPSAPSQAYEAAALLIRMATMVSAADGNFSAEEQQHLQQHVETGLSLDSGERRRLHAHLKWLMTQEQNMAGLTSKLEGLAEAQREIIGHYLVTVATADGYIDPGEIKTLQRLFGRLGLDPERVVGRLHSASAEPVTVKPAIPNIGFSIPDPPKEPTEASAEIGRAALDPAALQRKLEDTARVTALLHGIFGDEEPEEGTAQKRVETADAQTVNGLDAEHSAFARALGNHETWERAALEALAEHHGLLLDGALETINDAAFDECGALCIEGDDDGYVVDRVIYEEMTT